MQSYTKSLDNYTFNSFQKFKTGFDIQNAKYNCCFNKTKHRDIRIENHKKNTEPITQNKHDVKHL